MLVSAANDTCAQPAPNTLQPPPDRPLGRPEGRPEGRPVQEAAPKAPAAAPRQPVQQVGPAAKPPPVVKPQGTTHAQKPHAPPHKPADKPHEPSPPAVAAPVVPAPVVVAPPTNAAKPADGDKPDDTSKKVPRFAALRSDEVNLRAGPGTRYPIDWLYKRRDLPVEIEREFEGWRLIRDMDGIRGWVHQATLTGRRNFLIKVSEATMRADPKEQAGAVAILKSGVIGRIRACEASAEWCQVQVAGHRGYLKRDQIWGLLPNEAVAP